jgi:flavin reductase (DIM6/NTAB) family NADH-FMN oxidoreductase RutF
MSVDAASFRRALRQFGSGVTVVTTRDAAGDPIGLTVSAFCSVSLHPPLVLVCIAHHSETNQAMKHSGRFAVNVLAEDQEEVSRRFALPGRDKVVGFAFQEGRLGLPLVPDVLAQIECRVRSFHDEGDHAVWVGEVRAVASRPGRPLLYHAGTYQRLVMASRGGKPGVDPV